MGAFKGSMTATAWYVRGKLPKQLRDSFTRSLKARAFRDIEIESDQTESFGWVSALDAFDGDLTPDKWFYNDYVIFRLRQDVLKVAPSLFRLHLERARAEFLAESGRERLSRSEEDNLKELLERKLRRRLLPNTKVFEVVWNLDRGELWLFTSSQRLQEVFDDLFGKTFEGLTLAPRNVYSRLESLDLDDDQIDGVAHLEQTVFAARPHLRREAV